MQFRTIKMYCMFLKTPPFSHKMFQSIQRCKKHNESFVLFLILRGKQRTKYPLTKFSLLPSFCYFPSFCPQPLPSPLSPTPQGEISPHRESLLCVAMEKQVIVPQKGIIHLTPFLKTHLIIIIRDATQIMVHFFFSLPLKTLS